MSKGIRQIISHTKSLLDDTTEIAVTSQIISFTYFKLAILHVKHISNCSSGPSCQWSTVQSAKGRM